MRAKRSSSRIPLMVLGAIVAMAIIGRILTPDEGPLPGPIGKIPSWKSAVSVGKMGQWAVNPSGTLWAGSWSTEDKNDELYSAVWIVDFEAKTAKNYRLWPGASVTGLDWKDQNTVAVTIDGVDPGVSYIDATAMEDIAKPTASLASEPATQVLVREDRGAYGFLATGTGNAVPAFVSKDIPGSIEGTWASPEGILVLSRTADNFTRYVWEAKTGELKQIDKDGYNVDVKSKWPDAPQTMMFVTYRGGFSVDLPAGKTKQIFDYKDLPKGDEHWRVQIEDGRLYPRKDGGYTSVSLSAGTIDIRILDKDGRVERDLLARS